MAKGHKNKVAHTRSSNKCLKEFGMLLLLNECLSVGLKQSKY